MRGRHRPQLLTWTRPWPAWPRLTRYGYTVAWLDCLARGARLGRSVVTSGDFAAVGDLPVKERRDPLAFSPVARLTAPGRLPAGPDQPLHGRPATRLGTARRPAGARARSSRSARSSIRWTASGTGTRVYGPGGFRQYQFVVPFGAEADAAPDPRADRRRARSVFRDRAEALRPRRRWLPVLPHAGLDARPRLPGPHAWPGRPAAPARRPE